MVLWDPSTWVEQGIPHSAIHVTGKLFAGPSIDTLLPDYMSGGCIKGAYMEAGQLIAFRGLILSPFQGKDKCLAEVSNQAASSEQTK